MNHSTTQSNNRSGVAGNMQTGSMLLSAGSIVDSYYAR
jgi:hypothetical protein